jgi:hypothetical protein
VHDRGSLSDRPMKETVRENYRDFAGLGYKRRFSRSP